MTPLSKAVAAWRQQPARARRDAIHFFRDEARQSRDWAMGELAACRLGEAQRHQQDARAMDAALAVLRAAEKPRKARRK